MANPPNAVDADQDVPESVDHPCPVCGAQPRSFLSTVDGWHIYECDACGSASTDPLPTDDELREFYNSTYDPTGYWNKADKKMFRSRKRIFGLRLFQPKGRFLDVGCSAGYTVEAAREQGFDTLGIDLDEKSIDFARKRFPKGRFQLQTLDQLADSGRLFDLIHCSEVIEHVPDIRNFVRNLFKVCAPMGGLVYITTPDAGHKIPPVYKPPEHVHYLNRSSLRHLFADAGFKPFFSFYSPKPGLKILFKRP